MLLPVADLGMPEGPPPQAIIDKKWLWHVLLVLLCMCFLTRFIGLDIPGALLSGLMLCFVVIMTRDGMSEIMRYSLVFAVLCFLNFFFDLLPLMTELGGRVQSKTVPVQTTHGVGGSRQTEYRMIVTARPFFDGAEGFIYNLQSFSMILSPITMALGCYLAVSAHLEVQRVMPDYFADDLREDGLGGVFPRGGGAANAHMIPTAREDRAEAISAARRSPQGEGGHFQGRSFKLGGAPSGNK